VIRQSLSRLCGRARVRSSDSIRSAHRTPSTTQAVLATLEPLELRRLLSANYVQTGQFDSTSAGDGTFGMVLATQGDLALIGQSGRTVGANAQQGQVYLVNTSTNTLVRTFDDPSATPAAGDHFGFGAAFVGNKIAIGMEEGDSNQPPRIYLYADAQDTSPIEIDAPDFTGGQRAGFGQKLVSDGTYLYTSQITLDSGETDPDSGAIYKFDTTGTLQQTFTDAADAEHIGQALALSGNIIYATGSDSSSHNVVVGLDTATGQHVVTIAQPDAASTVFGTALAGTSNGDVFIGEYDPSLGTGAVYQYNSAGTPIQTYTQPADGALAIDFSTSMAVTDQNLLLVGAPTRVVPDANSSTGYLSVGAVYVYDIGSASAVDTISNPNPTEYSVNQTSFGYAVGAGSNGTVVISDPYNDTTAGVDAGTVYFFGSSAPPTNQPPVADAGAAQTTTENSTVTLDASGSTDPDGDTLSYAWDLNNDGVFDDATGVTVSFTQDLPGTYPVAVQVTDSAGHQSTASSSVTFTDVAPTANAGADQTAVSQQAVNFTGTGANASGDAIVSYEWDFNYDGSNFSADATGATASNTFTAPGTYTVALRVTDDDGQTAVDTTQVTVQSAMLQGNVLYVGGTAGTDSITIGASSGAVTVNGTSYSGANSVIIYAGDGNDTVTAYSAPASTTLEIYGGAGNDSLYAGGANDIIVGGDGNDLITGGKGRDLLIGGWGSDTINGDQDDDILIAGYTLHDNDPAALEGILGVWNSSASYDSRVAQLVNSSTGTLRPDVDVFDDGIADTLKGAAGTDFFSFNNDTDTADVKKFEDAITTTTNTTDPAPLP
jgi:hypothetical protein